jgi:hypothetical protein
VLADSNTIVNKWKNYFSLLLNTRNVTDVRQIEIHTAKQLASGTSNLQVEIAIANMKSINLRAVIKFRQNYIKQVVNR